MTHRALVRIVTDAAYPFMHSPPSSTQFACLYVSICTELCAQYRCHFRYQHAGHGFASKITMQWVLNIHYAARKRAEPSHLVVEAALSVGGFPYFCLCAPKMLRDSGRAAFKTYIRRKKHHTKPRHVTCCHVKKP